MKTMELKTVKAVSEEVEAAVAPILAKYGMKLGKRRGTYDASGFDFKMRFDLDNLEAQAEKAGQNIRFYAPHGLKLGDTLHTQGMVRKATLVDANKAGTLVVTIEGMEGRRVLKAANQKAWFIDGVNLGDFDGLLKRATRLAKAVPQEAR